MHYLNKITELFYGWNFDLELGFEIGFKSTSNCLGLVTKCNRKNI